MAFLSGQSWRLLKPWYTGGGPEQGQRRTLPEFSFVRGAGCVFFMGQNLWFYQARSYLSVFAL